MSLENAHRLLLIFTVRIDSEESWALKSRAVGLFIVLLRAKPR